mmetsp:Transcript_24957/g.78137  ORF Transcript_24957/g.78137 Transcript_24957/m.78137 type:complete len:285 (-) Transcript_24957:1105-1959(-)
MQRPSSTALTMVAKLSSASTMSAASLATSVPVMPMATPMADCCSAGASFTPSPVMAATSPRSLSIFTRRCLSRGSVRQKTMLPSLSVAFWSSSESSKKSPPTKALPVISSNWPKMPMSRLMATAVSFESPVIMMTRMPAFLQLAMASATSGRAGSLMPMRPVKTRSDSTLANFVGSLSMSGTSASDSDPSHLPSLPMFTPSFTAVARQRSGRRAISWNFSVMLALISGVMSIVRPPGRRTYLQRSSSISGAPLTKSRFGPPSVGLTSTLMLLRSRLNSSVASFS